MHTFFFRMMSTVLFYSSNVLFIKSTVSDRFHNWYSLPITIDVTIVVEMVVAIVIIGVDGIRCIILYICISFVPSPQRRLVTHWFPVLLLELPPSAGSPSPRPPLGSRASRLSPAGNLIFFQFSPDSNVFAISLLRPTIRFRKRGRDWIGLTINRDSVALIAIFFRDSLPYIVTYIMHSESVLSRRGRQCGMSLGQQGASAVASEL